MQETATLQSILKRNQQHFESVVPLKPGIDKIIALDFTENNTSIDEATLNDSTRFSTYINKLLADNHARFGIGGYGEWRSVYNRSRLFDAKGPEGPRRLHLGMDIWGKQYTPVIAPLDGIIHSFGFNDSFGDYGATVIFTHQIDGFVFHTLYGHLSRNSLKNLDEGKRIEKGEMFAEFGLPLENGHWPPHLHFQIIIDLEGWKADYPGVCAESEKEKFMANCPDPDLILQLNRYL